MSYLRADLRLECGRGARSALGVGGGFDWDERYNAMWWYSFWFSFVYPLGAEEMAARDCVRARETRVFLWSGIPLMYFCLLYDKRHIIAPKQIEGTSENAVAGAPGDEPESEVSKDDSPLAPLEADTSEVDLSGSMGQASKAGDDAKDDCGSLSTSCLRF